MAWLLLTVVLLPVNCLRLPLNMDVVDFWILVGLFVFWLLFALGRQSILINSYTVALSLILIASLASTFAAPSLSRSLVVVLKEAYLFIWFVTITALLSQLSAGDLRRVMWVWLLMVMLHGMLILAQFLSPDVWRLVSGLGGRAVLAEHFRPSGLFISEKAGDANKAAFFQLLGFVPLVLSGISKRRAMLFAGVILCSVLATGSMGGTVAFAAGLIVAAFAIFALGKHMVLIANLSAPLMTAIVFVGGLLFLISNEHYRNHFEGIIVRRAERSSEGRFDLWQRGLGVLQDRNSMFFWGIGPENFREVDGAGNQLHNDLLAFVVERGLLGGMALVLFGGIAVARAVSLLRMPDTNSLGIGLGRVVFLGAMAAIMVESLTHQVFHAREMWLVLALQEAMLVKMKLPA